MRYNLSTSRIVLKGQVLSPFQLNLGTVVLNLLYDNVFLGQGIGTNTTIVSTFTSDFARQHTLFA